jgi:hypothetical protein
MGGGGGGDDARPLEQQPLAVAASAPSTEGGTDTDEEAEPSVETRRRPQLVWPSRSPQSTAVYIVCPLTLQISTLNFSCVSLSHDFLCL